MKYRFYILMGVSILLVVLVNGSFSLKKQPEPFFSVNVCSTKQIEKNKLLLKVVKNSSITINLSEDPSILNQEIVRVMFNALKDGNDYAVKLWIELFDKCLEVTQTRVIKRSLYGYTWIGKINNYPFSNVLFTVGDKTMFGTVEYSGNIYKVEPIGDGVFHSIIKLDPTKIIPFDKDPIIP